jgi:lipopolysaccharide export system protein LptA
MALNVSRLRIWFATAAIALAVVVAGFYFYARLRVRRAVQEIPQRIGVNVQQSTEGFTLSKSEQGRTLFTVHASRAVQYKQGGRAELRDVSIIVYGRQANRYDQIYGSDFEYDPQTGDITARGEVLIDLEGNAEGPLTPDQTTPRVLKNPIHLKTSGLVFNHKTGVATTAERIEFRVPQASGSALGATYDSKGATLTLHSDIVVHATGPNAADITAQQGVITKGPNRAVLTGVRLERPSSAITASQLTAFLRDDNSIEHLLAQGEVRAETRGNSTVVAQAPRADAWVSGKNQLRSAALSGGVSLDSTGQSNLRGIAGRVLLTFAGHSQLEKVTATDGVKLTQLPGAQAAQGHAVEVSSAAMDLFMAHGHLLERAETQGAGQVTVQPAAGEQTHTVATAAKLVAHFERGRLATVVGTPDARIVSSGAGQADKVSTSRRLDVSFTPTGAIASLRQEGDFHYIEDLPGWGMKREAWSQRASYVLGSASLDLTGGPRVVEGGMTTTANVIRLHRRSGEATAEGQVKTTYSELKPQPGGALLATSDPIHVTAARMEAARAGGTATYSGEARLWQGSNIVQAPVIEFERNRRTILAHAPQGTPQTAETVSTVFVQPDKNGQVTPVSVAAARLTYVDAQRQARFEGGVIMKGAEATVTADRATVFLQPGRAAIGVSHLERVVAEGHVVVREPGRYATGDNLVYTSQDAKFVLTGEAPSIFDAERGKISGDSLTFYSRDDRVRVEGRETSPTVTQTRVPSR